MHLRSRRILIAASVFALMSSATAYADPVEVLNGCERRNDSGYRSTSFGKP